MSNVEYVFNKHSPQQHRTVEVTTNNSLHNIYINTKHSSLAHLWGNMPHLIFTGWLRETDSRAGLSVRCYRLAAAGGSVGDSVEAATFARHLWSCSQRPNAYSLTNELLLPHLLSVRLLIRHWGEAYWNINAKFWQGPPIAMMSANNPSI